MSMAPRQKLYPDGKQISFMGTETLHNKVRVYAREHRMALGDAFEELILIGLEIKNKQKQLVLPIK